MRICRTCQYNNREGMLFCEDCGESLLEVEYAIGSTRPIDEEAFIALTAPSWGTTHFKAGASIVLHIRDVDQPLTLVPGQQMLLGRNDPGSARNPDLDLTHYGALEKGVSRHHAIINRSEDTLTLVDMGSSNGTYLNGQRLIPQQPRVLRDGDEIRLGKLTLHIYFKASPIRDNR